MSKKELPAEDAGIDAAELGINTTIEAIAGVSLPGPVRQNALKALGRLFSAIVEIPSAYLESFAEEKRAVTEARKKLTETTAKQIARQIEVDEVDLTRFGGYLISSQKGDPLCHQHVHLIQPS